VFAIYQDIRDLSFVGCAAGWKCCVDDYSRLHEQTKNQILFKVVVEKCDTNCEKMARLFQVCKTAHTLIILIAVGIKGRFPILDFILRDLTEDPPIHL
jgi:hypothetical protein